MPAFKTFLSAGSNLGDPKANLEFALSELAKAGTVLQTSSYFETEPVGFTEQPWFLNLAIEFETRLSPVELLHLCLRIEDSRARKRGFPNAPRTLDLDILFYGNAVIRENNLIIPHPRLAERKFVLEPLAEIAPNFMHPIMKKSIQTLLKNCTDKSLVRLQKPPSGDWNS